MGMFLRNRHFVGAYKNGRHINGYFFNNHKLFHYKTNLYIKYVNPINSDTIATTKTKLDWNKWYTFNTLPVNIPAGYSDQAKYFLPGQSGSLGLQNISYDITRVYITWNVIPVTGEVTINYENSSGNILKTVYAQGGLNTFFDPNNYNNTIPTNYTYGNIISGNDISTYQPYSANATVDIQVNYQPSQGTININFYDTSSNTNVNQTSVQGNVGDEFNLTSYLNNIPSGYVYAGVSGNTNEFTINPQTVTIDVTQGSNSGSSSSSGGSSQGIITINYVDQNNNTVDSDHSQGIPGTLFDIQPYEMSPLLPNGYIYNETINGSDVTTYPDSTAEITISVIPDDYIPQPEPTSAQPVPIPPAKQLPAPSTISGSTSQNLQEVYRVFVDENVDESINPSTFSFDSPKKESQSHPTNPQQVFYIDFSAHSLDVNNLTYSNLGLSAATVIPGPNNYFEPYQDNTSFTNLYLYRPDTKQALTTDTLADGNEVVYVKCEPAFVKGVTFQYVIPSKSGGVSKHVIDAPSKDVTTPNNWSVEKDPYTGCRSYTVPYNTKITEQDLTNQLLGGNKDKFYAHSNKYVLEDNRTIQITAPYDFLLYCRS